MARGYLFPADGEGSGMWYEHCLHRPFSLLIMILMHWPGVGGVSYAFGGSLDVLDDAVIPG